MAKEIKVDNNLISSLLKSSKNKLKAQESIPLDNDTSSAKLSLAYDAVRELLEALAVKNGYKIYNHECYYSFLKELLNQSSIAISFDKLRKIRNAINYYGKQISADEARTLINDSIMLIKRINDIFE